MKTRESRYVQVARKAYQISQQVFARYAHAKGPHQFTQPQLVACVLLMFYVRKSYRDMEEWLFASESICQVLELPCVPDHTTLYRMFRRLRMTTLVQLKRVLLDELRLEEEGIVVDTTGYRRTQASEHYLTRRGLHYRTFVKGGYAVGAASQFILGWKAGIGPAADSPFLNPLRRQAARYGKRFAGQPVWQILADSGFDGKTVQPRDLIPPQRRGGRMQIPERKARLELVSQARLDGWFGQRWKAETVHSVIKRKFGDEIRSRKRSHRHREPMVKGLIYDLHRFICTQ